MSFLKSLYEREVLCTRENLKATVRCVCLFFSVLVMMVFFQLNVEFTQRKIETLHNTEKELYTIEKRENHAEQSNEQVIPGNYERDKRDKSFDVSSEEEEETLLDENNYRYTSKTVSASGNRLREGSSGDANEGTQSDGVSTYSIEFAQDRILGDISFSLFESLGYYSSFERDQQERPFLYRVFFDREAVRDRTALLNTLVNCALLYCFARCAFVRPLELKTDKDIEDDDPNRLREYLYRVRSRLTPIQHALLAMSIVYMIRSVTIVSTILPNPFKECTSGIRPEDGMLYNLYMVISGNEFTCYDVMFSGHAASLTLFACMSVRYFTRVEGILMTLYGVFTCVLIVGYRFHYTSDILVGGIISFAVYVLVDYASTVSSLQMECIYRETYDKLGYESEDEYEIFRASSETPESISLRAQQRNEEILKIQLNYQRGRYYVPQESTVTKFANVQGNTMLFRLHGFVHLFIPDNSMPFRVALSDDFVGNEMQSIGELSRNNTLTCTFNLLSGVCSSLCCASTTSSALSPMLRNSAKGIQNEELVEYSEFV